jgi:hypothetical protein
VDVADDSYRSLDVHNIALLHKHLFRLCAYCFYDRLGEQFLVVESLDALVEIDAGLQTSVLATRYIVVAVDGIQGSPGMFAAGLLSQAGAMGVGEEAGLRRRNRRYQCLGRFDSFTHDSKTNTKPKMRLSERHDDSLESCFWPNLAFSPPSLHFRTRQI